MKVQFESGNFLEFRQRFYFGYFGKEIVKTGYSDTVKEIVPKEFIAKREERDGDSVSQHVTLIIKSEFKKAFSGVNNLKGEFLDAYKLVKNPFKMEECLFDLFSAYLGPREKEMKILGIGRVKKGNDDVFFLVVTWDAANNLREALGLEKKDFHITLGFANKDLHDVGKGESTIVKKF